MKTLFYLAAAIALAGSLATCAPAKAQTNVLAQYVATLPPDVQRDTHAIRAALKRPVVTLTTNTVPRVRSANQKALVQAVVPAFATRQAFKDAPNPDAFLDAAIIAKLDGATAPTAGELRRIDKIQVLRMAILREGLAAAGDDADKLEPVVTRTEGPPRWQALGLAELPTLDAIRSAQR